MSNSIVLRSDARCTSVETSVSIVRHVTFDYRILPEQPHAVYDDAAFVEANLGLARSPQLLAELKALARHKAQTEFAADIVFATIIARVQRSLAEGSPLHH